MRHTLLMILLGVGAVAGFGAGFVRLHHYRHGDVCHLHSSVERRAAEACTRATLDVLEEQKTSPRER